MKKIVALGAIAALAGGMIFADEPAIDMKVAEFNGNATVKWGMDLDAGQHGFENSTGDTNLKVNLWNEGTKATEGDGIWGEVEIKGKGLAVKNGAFDGDGTVSVEKALIHLGDKAYIGIKSGDTQVGAYKFDGAIRSADNDNAKWLSDVGPADFSQGIVLGYGDDNFGIDVDLRSYKTDNTNYTSAYSIAAEAKLKDSNEFVSGLAVDAGVGYNISATYNDKDADDSKLLKDVSFKYTLPAEIDEITAAFDALAGAPAATPTALETAEKELKEAQEAFDKDPTSAKYDTLLTKKAAYEKEKAIADATEAATPAAPYADPEDPTKVNVLGYGVNVAYKFKIDDKYFIKPAVGFTGSSTTATTKDTKSTLNQNSLVAGVIFGWGDTADANAGVYFLDGDSAKKVTPGVSVVAAIPLAATAKNDDSTITINSAVKAIIVPSVYLGDLVENLKFAAYSEIALLNHTDKVIDPSDDFKTITYNGSAASKDRTTAMAVAAGLAYDIKSDDLTITPKAGIRYVNAAYVENKINETSPLSSNPVFVTKDLGISGKDEKGNNDYFNLKAGVDVNGLIANTTLFAEYTSANLLNDNEYKNAKGDTQKMYNIKTGTFNIGAKIHF